VSAIYVIPDGVTVRTCPTCNGWGWRPEDATTTARRVTCWSCLGAGRVWAQGGRLAPLRDLSREEPCGSTK
jgi:DnaJ-class molecular chaperone